MTLPTVFWRDDPTGQRLKEAIGALTAALGTPVHIIPGYLVLVETPAALPAAQAAPQLFVAQAAGQALTVSAETPAQTVSAATPPAATRACEICGAPVSGRWKVCASPVCQQERRRRYAAKYNHAQSAGKALTVSAETPPARTATETLPPATVSAETPPAAARACEICGAPVGRRSKVCASPVCQQERKRRYAAKYYHARNAGALSTVSAETPPARTTTETPYLTTVSAETPLALAAETEVGVRPAPFELDWPLAACCRVENGELAGQHLMAWELRQRLANRSLAVGTTLLLRDGKRARVESRPGAAALTPAG